MPTTHAAVDTTDTDAWRRNLFNILEELDDQWDEQSKLEDEQWEPFHQEITACTDIRAFYFNDEDNSSSRHIIHDLCFLGAPTDLIQDVIERDMDALKCADGLGRLALHRACFALNSPYKDCNIDVVLEAYSTAASAVSSYGDTPVRVYLEEAEHPSVEIVRSLLNEYPEAAVARVSTGEDGNNSNSDLLQCVIDRWFQLQQEDDEHENLGREKLFLEVLRSRLYIEEDQQNLDDRRNHADGNSLLHALLYLFCFDDATQQFENQHILVDVLLYILREDESAASVTNAKGKLPLHLAIERGLMWDTGIQEIINAAPKALETRDMQSLLYPFQMAAVENDHREQGDQQSHPCQCGDLNTLYMMLREKPERAQGMSLWNSQHTNTGLVHVYERLGHMHSKVCKLTCENTDLRGKVRMLEVENQKLTSVMTTLQNEMNEVKRNQSSVNDEVNFMKEQFNLLRIMNSSLHTHTSIKRKKRSEMA